MDRYSVYPATQWYAIMISFTLFPFKSDYNNWNIVIHNLLQH